MSAIKNIVLFVLALICVFVGAVIVYTVIIPTTPIQWAILGTGILVFITPLLWIHGMVKYFHESWKEWIDSNQMEDVPVVYRGYDLHTKMWEQAIIEWNRTIIDMTACEIELRQKTEELQNALARGAAYKFRKEMEMSGLWAQLREASEELAFRRDENEFLLATLKNLQKTNDQLTRQLAVYRLINWADKTHAGQIK